MPDLRLALLGWLTGYGALVCAKLSTLAATLDRDRADPSPLLPLLGVVGAVRKAHSSRLSASPPPVAKVARLPWRWSWRRGVSAPSPPPLLSWNVEGERLLARDAMLSSLRTVPGGKLLSPDDDP